jgi:hypothetical protein
MAQARSASGTAESASGGGGRGSIANRII